MTGKQPYLARQLSRPLFYIYRHNLQGIGMKVNKYEVVNTVLLRSHCESSAIYERAKVTNAMESRLGNSSHFWTIRRRETNSTTGIGASLTPESNNNSR